VSKKLQLQLEKLFLSHYNQWCLLSFSYLEDFQEAEEVVQNVCANILLRKQTTEILNLNAYVVSAIRNGSIKRIKQLKRLETIAEKNNYAVVPSFEENLIKEETRLYITSAIDSLPEPCKNIFKLCVIDGQKYQSVADTMSISVNTVKYHVKNAYKRLRHITEEAYLLIVIFIKLLFY